ncbi:MAG: T9SS type A sorting domain-containing protein, partial [Candidatus Marinimicrobia bacterium]|nr:T9SS type A sorting domain-containing protein [Candidatus Neomarinimicrobiota bacterium]
WQLCLEGSAIATIVSSEGKPSQGNGTPEDPFHISTFSNLAWITSNAKHNNYYYIQTSDINASESKSWCDGEGWVPIGENNYLPYCFSGNYNGQGYKIDSLLIPKVRNSSLFGACEGASILNLNLTNDNIIGSNPAGGISARAKMSRIENCKVSGKISGTNVGGICGWTYTSRILNCTNYAEITGTIVGGIVGHNDWSSTLGDCLNMGQIFGGEYAGGIVGRNRNSSIIGNCTSNGQVNGSEDVGGIVGECISNAKITNCYSESNVLGNKNIGGLIGRASYHSNVENCYTAGDVTGNENIGGLIGLEYEQNQVKYCYSLGKVTGTKNIGGLVGSGVNERILCFWDIETSGIDSSCGGIGKTSDELKNITTYSESGWDFTDTWGIDSLINNGYPYLQWKFPYVKINDMNIPDKYILNQNYPNPFNPSTTISYEIKEDSHAKLDVYNITGQLVETLADEYHQAGAYKVKWNASNLSSGIYIYCLEYGDKHISRKMLLIK